MTGVGPIDLLWAHRPTVGPWTYCGFCIDPTLHAITYACMYLVCVSRDPYTHFSADSVAQTMTDSTVLESSYTQTEGAARECRISSVLQTMEGTPGSGLVKTANVSVQAEMDARRVYQQMEKVQQKHQSAMKRLQRKFLAIRRRCQMEGNFKILGYWVRMSGSSIR